MKPLKTKISLTIDDPIIEKIRLLAENADRSMSSYINQVLKAHIEQQRKEGDQSSDSIQSVVENHAAQ